MSARIPIDRDALARFCRHHHIARLALLDRSCGRTSGRQRYRRVSGVQPGHVPGLRFVSIEHELSQLLGGRRIDMVTPKFLNPRIRNQVLSTAESLYVAA